MDLTIKTFTHGALTFKPTMPSGWLTGMHMPGSRVWSAEEDFGTIFLEEFNSGPFTVRFWFFRLLREITLYCHNHTPSVVARIAIKNTWQLSLKEAGQIRLQKGQFALYYSDSVSEKIGFQKGKEYKGFEILCAPGKLKALHAPLPELEDFLDNTQSGHPLFFVRKPCWTGPEAISVIRDVAGYPFKDAGQDYYVGRRLEELFFLLFILAAQEDLQDTAPTDEEMRAAQAAERIILADITQHHSIPFIARKVHLNEFRLKYVFKYIFKKGIFEYLLQARMNEARNLLMHSDKPIKEIASLTGYRLTSFITAFRKHFGYTPGSIRRST